MGKTVYIHDRHTGAIGFIFKDPDTKAVFTGVEVHSEDESPELEALESRTGLRFFRPGQSPSLPLYGVPEIYVFAVDVQGGYYASTDLPFKDCAVYRIDQDYVPRLAAPSFNQWLEGTEQPSGEFIPPADSSVPFRVFPSRDAAAQEFQILDTWELIRQKREPRFQVWPMESPADREGKAYVHYTAWQETYTGLMDPRILEKQSLDSCRRIAEKYPENTLVLLDREHDDRVAGFACYLPEAREFVSVPNAGEVCALYLLQEYQGLGLGKLLLESCLACINRSEVALFVLKGNEKAIGFYEHMGFRFTGRHQTEKPNGCDEFVELEMVMERG